jgi:hypothetical protein
MPISISQFGEHPPTSWEKMKKEKEELHKAKGSIKHGRFARIANAPIHQEKDSDGISIHPSSQQKILMTGLLFTGVIWWAYRFYL